MPEASGTQSAHAADETKNAALVINTVENVRRVRVIVKVMDAPSCWSVRGKPLRRDGLISRIEGRSMGGTLRRDVRSPKYAVNRVDYIAGAHVNQ